LQPEQHLHPSHMVAAVAAEEMVGALDDKTLVLTGSATPPPRRWWLWAPRRTCGSSSADAMCQAQSGAQGASRPRLGHVQRCLMCRFCDDIFVENPSAQLGDGLAVVSRGDGEGPCSKTKPPMSTLLYNSSPSSDDSYGSGVVTGSWREESKIGRCQQIKENVMLA